MGTTEIDLVEQGTDYDSDWVMFWEKDEQGEWLEYGYLSADIFGVRVYWQAESGEWEGGSTVYSPEEGLDIVDKCLADKKTSRKAFKLVEDDPPDFTEEIDSKDGKDSGKENVVESKDSGPFSWHGEGSHMYGEHGNWIPRAGIQTSFVPKCRHEPVHVIKGKKGNVWAGSRYLVTDYFDDFTLLLNLTGSSDVPKHIIPIPSLQQFARPTTAEEIVLDWPDMSVPQLNKQFWIELWKEIETNGQKVLIFCIGGHGRTGTALASLLIACGYSAKEATRTIHKVYCKEAIESESQREYLKSLEKYVKKHRKK